MTALARSDVYARVTADIVRAIEAGAASVQMPWHRAGPALARPCNLASGKPYRGANVLALWIAAQAAGFPTGLWGTYRQWLAAGAQVRRGETATTIVFWKTATLDPECEERGGEGDRPRQRFLARGYSVFNAGQVDGYQAPPAPVLSEAERIDRAEAFYGALNIPTVFGGSEAYYVPAKDTVFLPPFAAFRDAEAHYAVRFHEAMHASSAPARCDRSLTGRFGSEAYAMEELVAELGSALILADLGISSEPRPDHAGYIASWLRVLKNDASAVFTAASRAQAAADWMHAQQPPG